MAFWHLQDNRYKQERILLLASVIGLVGGLGGLGWLYWQGDSFYAPALSSDLAAPLRQARETEEKRTRLADLHRDLAIAVDARHPEAIERVALTILAEEPDDAEAFCRLGGVYAARGDYEKAFAAYDKAVSLPSKRKSFYLYQKACLFRARKDLPAAIAAMRESARLSPESAESANLLMIFQLEAGQDQAVREELKSYAALDLDSQRVMWLLGAAALALREGDTARARQSLEDFRQRVPADVFKVLTEDSYFDAYRDKPEYLVSFMNVIDGKIGGGTLW